MAGIVVFTLLIVVYFLFFSSGKKSSDSSKKSKEGIVLAQPRDDTQYIEAIAQKINRTFGYE
jgi:cell division protein FtsN